MYIFTWTLNLRKKLVANVVEGKCRATSKQVKRTASRVEWSRSVTELSASFA